MVPKVSLVFEIRYTGTALAFIQLQDSSLPKTTYVFSGLLQAVIWCLIDLFDQYSHFLSQQPILLLLHDFDCISLCFKILSKF